MLQRVAGAGTHSVPPEQTADRMSFSEASKVTGASWLIRTPRPIDQYPICQWI